MANFLIQQGTLLESFETFSDWTVQNGTARVTSGGLELTSGVGTNCIATKTISANLSMQGTWKITFSIADIPSLANIDAIDILVSSTTNFAKYFEFLKFSGDFHSGSNEILINRTKWTNTGGEDWSNTMVRLRVRVNAKPGTTAVLRFDELYTGYYSRPKCIFNFDDGYLSTYTQGYTYLRKYGFRGVSYVNSGRVDVNGAYMTTDQVRELYSLGWDIGNHTKDHVHMDQVDAATLATQIDDCEAYLIANGFTRSDCHRHFCYPYGDYNQAVIDAVAARGYLTARSTINGRTQVNNLDNRYLLLWTGVPAVGDIATAKSYVDRTIADGGVMMWGFHSLVTSPTLDYEWDIASFQALVDYIAQRREQIDVVTMTEWYRGLTQARRAV